MKDVRVFKDKGVGRVKGGGDGKLKRKGLSFLRVCVHQKEKGHFEK